MILYGVQILCIKIVGLLDTVANLLPEQSLQEWISK